MEIIQIIAAILLGYLAIKLIALPIKLVFKLLLNAALGLLLLFVFNIFGSIFNFELELNFLNAVICGVFGIPGLIFLIIVKLFF